MTKTQARDKLLIFRINKCVREIEGRHGLSELSLACREILYHVASEEADGRKVSIFGIVGERRFGTPPTAYTRLDQLEKSGWIERRRHEHDGRIPTISLTPRARRLFSVLSHSTSELLHCATGEHRPLLFHISS